MGCISLVQFFSQSQVLYCYRRFLSLSLSVCVCVWLKWHWRTESQIAILTSGRFIRGWLLAATLLISPTSLCVCVCVCVLSRSHSLGTNQVECVDRCSTPGAIQIRRCIRIPRSGYQIKWSAVYLGAKQNVASRRFVETESARPV